MASCTPSKWVIRTTPPAPGSRPRVTSGSPTLTLRSFQAIRRLWSKQSSNPPPSAAPLMAATFGTGSCS